MHSAESSAVALPSEAPQAEIIPLALGRYAIPAEDTLPGGPWASLKQLDRARINTLLDCFRQMEAAKNLRREAAALAFRFRGIRGFSAGSLVSLYYAWREQGWAALRHDYKANATTLPGEFLEHWRALCEKNARSINVAKDRLYTAWFAGEAIPGYGTWVDWWHRENPLADAPRICPGVPAGWSKSTLYAVGPTTIERRWATRGLAAVKTLLPTLVRDTSKLLPLQLLTMDDFETDQVCFAKNPRTGAWQVVKVTGVAVMDVATRRVIAVLMKPRFVDEEGKREAITRAEVRLLFFQVLRDNGIPHCGQTWLVENAAAAITTELEITVRNLFGGRVQVTRTGLIHDKVFANGFIERGGKPQQKGWIEARFNLVHNEAADLPGQKGANYLVKPGDHESKVAYAEKLIGDGRDDAQLSDEQIARLRMPFKTADELIAYYMSELFPKLDRRIEHKMGGFELLRRWRRDASDTWHEWEELATLSVEQQMAVEFFPRELRESPRMRWDRLMVQVKTERIAAHVLMMLLLTPKSAKVRNGRVAFVHNGKGYAFADKRALALRLPEATDVLCYFDPASPSAVHVCDVEGRYLVELRNLHVDITDQAAMDDATRSISELYHSILGGIRQRPLHQQADAQQAADRAHNAAIVAEAKPAALDTRKQGLTAVLNRPVAAPTPGAPVHTATAEATANVIAEAATAHAARRVREGRGDEAALDALTDSDPPPTSPAESDDDSGIL